MGQSNSAETLSSAPKEDTKASSVTLAPELEGTMQTFDLDRLHRKHCDSSSRSTYWIPIYLTHSLLCGYIPCARVLIYLRCIYTATILRDFQNQTVQEEWNRFRAVILNRRNERQQQQLTATQQQHHERHMQALKRQERLSSLDVVLEDLRAKFADASIALEHDISHVVTQQTPTHNPNHHKMACVGERAHWMDCASKYGYASNCDAYIRTLEKCVNETITSKVVSE